MDARGRHHEGGGRGGLLTSQDEYVATSLSRSHGLIDVSALTRLWARLRRTPRTDAPDVWTHGDLMPGNLLARDRRLAAVIDVGGLAPADPALDLMPAWNLMEPTARQAYRAALDVDDPAWDRGKGWAFAQAVGCLYYYRVTNPVMSATARRTLEACCPMPPPDGVLTACPSPWCAPRRAPARSASRTRHRWFAGGQRGDRRTGRLCSNRSPVPLRALIFRQRRITSCVPRTSPPRSRPTRRQLVPFSSTWRPIRATARDAGQGGSEASSTSEFRSAVDVNVEVLRVRRHPGW